MKRRPTSVAIGEMQIIIMMSYHHHWKRLKKKTDNMKRYQEFKETLHGMEVIQVYV
jgi:hypothetical protein